MLASVCPGRSAAKLAYRHRSALDQLAGLEGRHSFDLVLRHKTAAVVDKIVVAEVGSHPAGDKGAAAAVVDNLVAVAAAVPVEESQLLWKESKMDINDSHENTKDPVEKRDTHSHMKVRVSVGDMMAGHTAVRMAQMTVMVDGIRSSLLGEGLEVELVAVDYNQNLGIAVEDMDDSDGAQAKNSQIVLEAAATDTVSCRTIAEAAEHIDRLG